VSLSTFVVNPVIKGILNVIARIDATEMARLPYTGPAIVCVNHINFLEVPLIHLYTRPRPAVGLVKRETWDQFFVGRMASAWNAIPVDRGGNDVNALRAAESHLAAGGMILIAPEGTRSGNGVLRPARAGIITLAIRTGAPIIPVAHYGGEAFWTNIKRVRRTPVTFRVGEPFSVSFNGTEMTRQIREAALTETMGRLAALLPDRYRGWYRDAAASVLAGDTRWTRALTR